MSAGRDTHGPVDQNTAICAHGACASEGHETRMGRAQTRARARLPLSSSCRKPAGETRYGLSLPLRDNLHPWLLLASPCWLPARPTAEVATGFLGAKVDREPRS